MMLNNFNSPRDVSEIILEVLASSLDVLDDPLRQDDEGSLDVFDVAADPRVARDEDVPGHKLMMLDYP